MSSRHTRTKRAVLTRAGQRRGQDISSVYPLVSDQKAIVVWPFHQTLQAPRLIVCRTGDCTPDHLPHGHLGGRVPSTERKGAKLPASGALTTSYT